MSEADIVAFGGISGDFFYMHFDEIAAKESAFGQRIAHGYFVLSAAAGLFVSPAPGPVLANYGLDTLRFVKPVAIGDTIRARLTCKRKIDRNRKDAQGRGQGVVAWDVEVTNQDGEIVASYDILTLVAKRAQDAARLTGVAPRGKPLRARVGRSLESPTLHTPEKAWPRVVAPRRHRKPRPAGAGPRILKKYPNRRLYDTEISSYITLSRRQGDGAQGHRRSRSATPRPAKT